MFVTTEAFFGFSRVLAVSRQLQIKGFLGAKLRCPRALPNGELRIRTIFSAVLPALSPYLSLSLRHFSQILSTIDLLSQH